MKNTYRICYDKRGAIEDNNILYFHCWAGVSKDPFAIVETHLGFIKTLKLEHIYFINAYAER